MNQLVYFQEGKKTPKLPFSAFKYITVDILAPTCIKYFFCSLYSRGEVCTMAPLHLHDGMKEHPLYEQSLLALATLTKVKVLMVII